MRWSSFSEFPDSSQLAVASELLHVDRKCVQKLLEFIQIVFTVQQALPTVLPQSEITLTHFGHP